MASFQDVLLLSTPTLKLKIKTWQHKLGNMDDMRSSSQLSSKITPPKLLKAAAGCLASSTVLIGALQSAAFADELTRWENFVKAGEVAFDGQKYGRAEHYFYKAVREADRTELGDEKLALSLRKLGEADTAAHKYKEAEAHFQRAIKVSKDCGVEDRDAIRDLLELAKTYRSVNLEQFGKNVATILKETGLDGIEILNNKDGKSRIVVRFADKFDKHINSADVNEINVDKKLTFDIHEDKDGTITLTNIKGLKIRSKMWVNLTDTSIDPNGEDGKPTALVTAEKLGLTKTIKTVMPKPVYDRILTVVERIRHPELHSPWHKQLQEKIAPKPPATAGETGSNTDSVSSATTSQNTASGTASENTVRQFASGNPPKKPIDTSVDTTSSAKP
ncbi:MAG TPA: tetratricopeptide repeat protein [Oculatellaceae cyanobacterium]